MKRSFSRTLKTLFGRGATALLIGTLLLAALPVTPAYAAAGTVAVTVGVQTGTLTYGTEGSVTFTVTVSQSGQTSPSILLSVPDLPSDYTASWSVNPVAGAHAPGTTTTLTVASASPHPVTPAGNLSFTVTNSIDANTGAGTLVIDKAAAVITVTPYDVTYDGVDHTATGTAVGIEASPADLSSLLDLSATTHTVAGSYAADAWTFAGNENYNSASGTVSDNISKADAVIQITGYSVIYDGSEHVATGTATGVEASPADLSGLLDLTGTAHTDVGSYAGDAWSFAGNENYNIANGTVDDEIVAAMPVFEASPAAWDFPILKVNLTSLPQVFTITNTGNVDLLISAVSLTGPDAGQFLITTPSPCASAIPAGGNCAVTVVFKPTTATPGTKTASLSFTDNAGNHDLPLTGKAATQAVLNGSFETYPSAVSLIPKSWTATGFSVTDGKTKLFKKIGRTSIKISNTSAVAKSLSQTRLIAGSAGDTFLFSAWVKGAKVPSTPGLVRVQAVVYNGTTVVQRVTLDFPGTTYDFTQNSKLVTTTSAYTKIVIKVIYSKGGGTVWFDGVSLLRSH